MAIPFIIAGALAIATGYGAKKGHDGYKNKSAANDITERALEKYELVKSRFDNANKSCHGKLKKLGQLQLQVGKDFSEFQTIASDLLKKLNCHSSKNIHLNIPQHELDEIEKVSVSALSVLGTTVGAGAAGAAAAYAAYGGVLAFGAASTGTPIATLSGAAAYNAAMAALGGGALSAGGFGMAGGAIVLGSAVAAPIIAIAGWAYNNYAEKALEHAKATRKEIADTIDKMESGISQFKRLEPYIVDLRNSIQAVYGVFSLYFDSLKEMNEYIKNYNDISQCSEQIIEAVENGYKIAAILADLITTPLFKLKRDKDGNIELKDNIPQIETDHSGLQVLNEEEISIEILEATKKTYEFINSR